MSEHSQISPSMLHRIMGDEPCFASVQMQADIPEPPSSEAAMVGTQLHELAEQVLNGVIETDSEIVNDYVDYVYDVAKGNKVYPEVRVSLEEYVDGMFGTADAVVIDRAARTMHVIDLKTGQHPVSADENSQLMAYALGALEEFDLNEFDLDTIRLHIAQPPINNYSTYDVVVSDLVDFGINLREAADFAYESNPAFGPTESNCRFCKFAPQCPELYKHNLAVVNGDFEALPEPSALTDEQIAKVVEHRSMVSQWMLAVVDYATDRMTQGHGIDGLKLVESRTQRKWRDDAEAELVVALGDDAYSKKLIGIGKVEKMMGKSFTETLTVKPVGSLSAVPVSDRRPALDVSEDFEHLDKQ